MSLSTMHMNVATGSVASLEQWKSDQKSLGFDIAELDSLIMVVSLDGHWHDFDVVVNLMDDEIREHLHSTAPEHITEQEFVDLYRVAHREKFDEEFTVN